MDSPPAVIVRFVRPGPGGPEAGGASKTATTRCVKLVDTAQVSVPSQPAPNQPTNDEPMAGDAVSVTIAPFANAAVQVAPQSIPGIELVTVPEPLPPLVTLRVVSNVAVTL